MQEIVAKILIILRGAWRYRWQGAAVAWLVAIAGWVGVQFIPDQYQSRTQVYVDTESLLKPLLTGLAVNRDVMSQVAMMQAVMLSRPNLEKVAQQNDMLLEAKTQRDVEAVIDDLAKKINLARPSGSNTQNTFVVSYEDQNPTLVHGVVRSLLDTFMEGSLGMKRTDAGMAQRFLQGQLTEYESKLTEAEQRLAAFKQQNVGLLPGFGGDYYQRLESELGTLQQMQQRVSQLSQRRDELQRQLAWRRADLRAHGLGRGQPDRRTDCPLSGPAGSTPAAVHREASAGPGNQANDRPARIRKAVGCQDIAERGAPRRRDYGRSGARSQPRHEPRVPESAPVAEPGGRRPGRDARADGLPAGGRGGPALESEFDPGCRGGNVSPQPRLCREQGAVRHAAATPGVGEDFAAGRSEHGQRQVPHHRAADHAGETQWARSARCSIRWCCSLPLRPASASRCCLRNCIRPSRPGRCCRPSPESLSSAPSAWLSRPNSCPGTADNRR